MGKFQVWLVVELRSDNAWFLWGNLEHVPNRWELSKQSNGPLKTKLQDKWMFKKILMITLSVLGLNPGNKMNVANSVLGIVIAYGRTKKHRMKALQRPSVSPTAHQSIKID